MYGRFASELRATLGEIRAAGLYKHERQLASPQPRTCAPGRAATC